MSSDNPGGTMVVMRPGAAARARAGWDWYQDAMDRDPEGLSGITWVDSIDGHNKPPKWVEQKHKTVLGYPILPSDRDENYWEVKYAKELYIGEQRFEKKKMDFQMEQHDIIGTARNIMRAFGYWNDDEKTSEQLTEEATEAYEKRLAEARSDDKQKKLDWNTFVTALESDKPLLKVANDYRNVYDCYGVDECLDSTLSMLWLSFKIGGLIGLCQGGFRAVKIMHVDAAFLNATGIGVFSFANVSMLAGLGKWAGNLTVACAFFLMGDRLVREAKRRTLPEEVEPIRTPVNYAVGMSGAFGVVGILPWWILNDKAMAARLAISSGIVGGAFGYMVGMGMQQLIALNLARLYYTPGQFRAYQALMKREKVHVDDETLRMKKLRKAQADKGIVPA